MNPLLSRFFGGNEKQEVQEIPIIPKTIHSLEEHQRVSVVGWIANKLGQLIGVEQCDDGKLLLDGLSKDFTELDQDNQEDYLFFLANSLVTWIEKDEDVYFNIKMMELASNYHKHLLEVYELVKSYDNIYFNKKNPIIQDISEEDKEWEIYRDVLHAASSRKFLMVKDQELEQYRNDELLLDEPVETKEDIPLVRNKAKAKLQEIEVPSSKIASYVLLISEAITNMIKHANGGRLKITKSEKSIHFLIEDRGSGFPLKILPYTVLMSGYSTKKSLGQGFTLMLKLSSRVLLKTSSTGSTIVLILEEEE